tara:strand:+ start:360 stop:722 length:363 start_codon:yes stop_codon:yes gene_type:complete
MKQSAMNNFNKLATNETPLSKQKELLGLEYLNAELPQDEINYDAIEVQADLYTNGDSLIYQFYCGNWSASIQEMKDHFIWWNELLDYMNESETWCEFITYNDHFDHAFWGELGYALGRKS